MKKRIWPIVIVFAALGGYFFVRRLGLRGGATDDEVDASLPGDEVIPHPMIETTHAITIQAPPSVVWRWLVQAGYRGSGRAGWYTDSPIDPLADLFFRMTTPADRQAADQSWMHSADRILPEFQQHTVGDVVPDGPPGTAYFTVRAVEPERLLVLIQTRTSNSSRRRPGREHAGPHTESSPGTLFCDLSAQAAHASSYARAPAWGRLSFDDSGRRCSTCLKRSFHGSSCMASSGAPKAESETCCD